MKERINNFFEEMPVFMDELDELTTFHPFIGGTSLLLHAYTGSDQESSCCFGFQDRLYN